jgi:hypothetical protein
MSISFLPKYCGIDQIAIDELSDCPSITSIISVL